MNRQKEKKGKTLTSKQNEQTERKTKEKRQTLKQLIRQPQSSKIDYDSLVD